MRNVLPVLLFILFGFLLRRMHYFKEDTIQGMTKLVSDFFIPCIIFTTFFNLEFRVEYFALAAFTFLIQVLLMGAGFLSVRLFRLKRRFAALYPCAFAFGFMAIPLFSSVFGAEHMGYLTSMGVGHELFIGLVFLPVSRIYLKHEKMDIRQIGKNLLSPLFIMILLALAIRGFGWKEAVEANILGMGLIEAVAKLGGISSTLILIIVGYRIRLDSLSQIRESLLLVGVRYGLIFLISYTIKYLFMDPLVGHDFYFEAAFFTLISQHGSVILNAYIGEYGTREDTEIASNAFAINALMGIALFVAYVFQVSGL